MDLSRKDIQDILEALQYRKIAFEDYDKYPSKEFKRQRIKETEDLIQKIRLLKNK